MQAAKKKPKTGETVRRCGGKGELTVSLEVNKRKERGVDCWPSGGRGGNLSPFGVGRPGSVSRKNLNSP